VTAVETRLHLLRCLADGRFHSGEDLALELGVSRAAIWKQVRALRDAFGVQVNAVRGRGYRLEAPLDLLDVDRIREAMRTASPGALAGLTVLDSVDSTNNELLRQRFLATEGVAVCVAEQQTGGRGRRGRRWVSPFGCNLYLSVARRFEQPAAALGGLSLAAGVAVASALASEGAEGTRLKWPNDLLWDGRKMGGILVEMSGEADGPSYVVIGVGINVCMPPSAGESIDQPWVDLLEATGGNPPRRSRLAGVVLDRLIACLAQFQSEGLAPFLPAWRSRDGLAGRHVEVHVGDASVEGCALGVADDGALLVATPTGERRFLGGEVSLRPRPVIAGEP
jgi:BirA family biotin operon repressor/biotin-[acetyl-CoA-carboxylase] ligase